MRDTITLRTLSDHELLRRLSEVWHQSRRAEAELIAHIAEVDRRRLYEREAASSMFVYCCERLNLSEQQAYQRIAVARASRRHPMLLTMLADGRFHLCGAAILARHLTERNRDRLLERAAGRSKRLIEVLVAELAPKPDVPPTMRKLPQRPQPTRVADSGQPGADRVERETSAAPSVLQPSAPSGLFPGRVESAVLTPPRRPTVEPLAPALYKVTFTASADLHDKLERLQALMRSALPDADLAAVIEQAVSEKLERLEAKRFAKVQKPRKTLSQADASPSSRYIPAPVRRAVHERDGGQCRFVV